MRYTTAPAWFMEPRTGRIMRVAEREGLTDMTLDEQNLIVDLCCVAAGATVNPFDGRPLARDAADYAADKLSHLSQRGEISQSYWDQVDYVTQFSEEFIDFHRSIHRVLRETDLNDIPGPNSLVRAVRLVRLLRKMEQANRQAFYAVYANAFSILMQALAAISGLTDEEIQLLNGLADSDGSDEASAFFLLELAIQKVDLTEMLRMARHLDDISELNREKAAPRADPEGEDVRRREIDDLSELPLAGASAYSLPRRLMLYRAVTGDLSVPERITRRDKQQLLYILLDGTASMQGKPAGRAAGVVMSRLQAVIDGDAELYLRFFDYRLGEVEYHADSLESARALMEVVTSPLSYTGMYTDFDGPLDGASRRVRELVQTGDLKDEEIFLVTDGNAPIPNLGVLRGTKLHTVQVGDKEVPDLSKLARDSGGVNIILPPPSGT